MHEKGDNVPIMNWYYRTRAGLDIAGFWKLMAGFFLPEFALIVLFAAYWLQTIPHESWPVPNFLRPSFVIQYVGPGLPL